MYERARFMDEVCAEIREAVQLFEPVRHIAQEYRDIVIGVLTCVSSGPRAKQDDTLKALTVHRVQRGPKPRQHRVVGLWCCHGPLAMYALGADAHRHGLDVRIARKRLLFPDDPAIGAEIGRIRMAAHLEVLSHGNKPERRIP